MTIFDYLVLFVLICSVVISAFNGFVKEGLSFAGWNAAFWIANAYGEALSKLLPDFFSNSAVLLITAYVVLFVGVKLLAMMLEKMLQRMVEEGGYKTANRGLGALFGLGKGIVIVLAVTLLCGATAVPQQAFWKQALLSPVAEAGVRMILPLLPYGFARQIHF
ncbi:MAG: CvpA family protein [Oxalobacter sp.]|nr:MAG: CvpA family protein [Oxalobacter sp.]